MDEAGLRLSARNQILTYLSEKKPASDETKELANQIALDGLADLSSHSAEILPFMANYLSNNLGAWIQKYRPELTVKFLNAVKANCWPCLTSFKGYRVRVRLFRVRGAFLTPSRGLA
jgi:hypothetical protein